MTSSSMIQRTTESGRHRTAWIESGPADGPLLLFLHGWPELSIVWRRQLEHFAGLGFRAVAPDMRGYGGSSVPRSISAYALRELVADMTELHDVLGGRPAVWIGHDWGSAVAWALASHHAERCKAVINLCVPYIARGFALPNVIPLVERTLYPLDKYPVGQWDYWLYYREHFRRAAQDFEADAEATLRLAYRKAAPRVASNPARTANIRAQGGWFGQTRRAPHTAPGETLLGEADFALLLAAFQVTGFMGANAWYMNDAANLAFAAEAPNFGRLTLPALFVHATHDTTCDTTQSRLAEPMREDCEDLTEVTIEAGHEVMLECPDHVNQAITNWLRARSLP